jgi:molybdate transport system substrate-binding protein
MLKAIILGTYIFISSLYSSTISVAVAANVSYTTSELIKEFNKVYPDTKVRIILGSSGKLTAQIKHGAPYQLFMSADMKYPERLYTEKIAINEPIIYANGLLAFLSTKKRDFSLGMQLLEKESIRKIAIANPKTAPYGKATLEAFKASGIYKKIKDKLVYAESASAVVSYAISAADIGIVPKSTLFSDKMRNYKKGINWVDVDSSLYSPIHQGIVILQKGKNNQEVLNFYKFILSDKAKKIFKEFGYISL